MDVAANGTLDLAGLGLSLGGLVDAEPWNASADPSAAGPWPPPNMTLEHYLERMRGPKHLPLTVVWPLTVIYVVIFVTGVIGNVAVCVVIVRNASMHTATNYYLFSLAVSDLALLLLGLPYELSVYWQQYPWTYGEVLCKFRALVSEMTSYTSVLTIVAFSLERYLAICHPLQSYRMSGLRRAVRIIAVLWIVSFVAALPFSVLSTVHYLEWPIGSGLLAPESAFCAMLDSYMVYETSSLLFFLLPMLVMVVIYGRIGSKIRSRGRHSLGKRVEGTMHGETKQTQTRKAIIRMLSAVVIAFFLCWAPFHSQRLVYLYGQDLPHFAEINAWLYYVTGVLYFFGSTVNPILYNLMSVKYRMAFRETLCGSLSPSAAAARGGFREQSSFRDTSVHQVGESGNGVKWHHRGGNGTAAGGSTRRFQRHGVHSLGPAVVVAPPASPQAAQLLENGSVLEPHWKDPADPARVAADVLLDVDVVDGDADGVGADLDGCQSVDDGDAGSELVVMISPAHRKPRVYAVGKVSRKWPKVLMLKVARKQTPAAEAVPAQHPAAATAQQGETCI
ncbi:Periviscerokinin Receptor [Frankliniella occidentalis]|uniref:Neuropeptides capa receptor-like n=1 Tax=Frankliniella occidentalis TaxID=133901 RepID=A0A6J1S1B8_FRAOC|nr:neuropeptides capa receptor-like [Frankliniella occidentalis]XP_026274954.1 neuropeptides capa receptor-like [Frankliniella occidentalis]KAE8752645.1 Periviscerokinin Receptor [Frankliniella occidentalis]